MAVVKLIYYTMLYHLGTFIMWLGLKMGKVGAMLLRKVEGWDGLEELPR